MASERRAVLHPTWRFGPATSEGRLRGQLQPIEPAPAMVAGSRRFLPFVGSRSNRELRPEAAICRLTRSLAGEQPLHKSTAIVARGSSRQATESGGKRAGVGKAQGDGDLGDRHIPLAEHHLRTLDAPREMVLVRRLAEGFLERPC